MCSRSLCKDIKISESVVTRPLRENLYRIYGSCYYLTNVLFTNKERDVNGSVGVGRSMASARARKRVRKFVCPRSVALASRLTYICTASLCAKATSSNLTTAASGATCHKPSWPMAVSDGYE